MKKFVIEEDPDNPSLLIEHEIDHHVLTEQESEWLMIVILLIIVGLVLFLSFIGGDNA